MCAERVDQRELGAVERPVRGEVAAVLVAVRVTEHHLLPPAASVEPRAVAGQRERVAHDTRAACEIVDRLEQRHDVDGERIAAQQPDLLQQHRDFEQVGNRLALRDHVVRQRRRRRSAGGCPRRRRGSRARNARAPSTTDAESAAGAGLRARVRAARCARLPASDSVVVAGTGVGQQLGDDRLVHVGVLAQVEHGKMEAEHRDGTDAAVARRRAASSDAPCVASEASIVSKVCEQLARRWVRRQLAVRRARRHVAGERLRGRGDPRVDADQRLPVGLVGTMRIVIVGGDRERQQRRRRLHEPRRQRQLAAQQVDFAPGSARTRRAACAAIA